jgi:plasmid stabilization system protein ParE
MIPCHLRPKAREDLESIADFTLEKWGFEQEELYLWLLKQALNSFSDNFCLDRVNQRGQFCV